MNRIAFSAYLAISVLATGCAGELLVYDEDQQSVKGVPFRAAEVYVKKGIYSKHSKGGSCTSTPFVDTISLPTGSKYFVSAKSAQFNKTAFHIKFTDIGAVAEIGLDSEPAAAETLKASNDLIKTLFPSLAASSAGAAGGEAALIEKACDAGETEVKFVKFDEYIRTQGK